MVSGCSEAECRKDEFSFMSDLTSAISLESGSKKRQCKVLFEYIPQNEDELELKLGDVIDIVDEVSCSTELAIHVLRVKPLVWGLHVLQACQENSIGSSVFAAKVNNLGVLSLRI